MSWLGKYTPQTPEDLLITKENYNKIYKWLDDFKNKKGANCLYLYGPMGCGKTIIAHTFLNYFGYDIIEKNISNIKKKTDFNNNINDILQKKNILNMFNKTQKEIGIILDEIDGLSSKEMYIFTDLLNTIFSKKPHRYLKFNPFIIISNSLNTKMKPYKSRCVFVEICFPLFNDIETLCKYILNKEGFLFNANLVKNIIETSRYDLRQIIINLEFNFKKEKNSHACCKNNYKNSELTDYKYIELHLCKYNMVKSHVCSINKNIIYMLFYENFIDYILKKKKRKNHYTTIISIYKNFSDSDIIDYILYKYMYWELIVYNNVFKIIHNSFVINNIPNLTNNKQIQLNYSLLNNKNSMEFINIKIINKYSDKLYKNSRSFNIYSIVNLLNSYKNSITSENIDQKEFKKLIKFIK